MAAEYRQQLLADGIEERVEANTRHLIDKILARYSAAHTIYRELVQNSNDAGADTVEIRFDSVPVNPSDNLSPAGTLPTHFCALSYRNNGRIFTDADWHRLKSIAEGNPDETKIGFFGVGFYSLFSVCEEPFVRSGDTCLGFFWRGDALFAKRGKIPADQVDHWTNFSLDLREPQELPGLNDFSTFLAHLLIFTESLATIVVYLDDRQIIKLSKTSSPQIALEIPAHIERASPKSLFSLTYAGLQNIQMAIDVLQEVVEEPAKEALATRIAGMFGFGSRKIEPPKPKQFEQVSSTAFLRVARAQYTSKASEDMIKQFQRTTKKAPPSSVTLKAVYTTLDELELTRELAALAFQAVVPTDQGQIYIGFKTHQTTGAAAHLAGPFIPTVERESLDLVDPTLTLWNMELLGASGIFLRILYDEALASCVNLDEPRYAHLVNAFSFRTSTPAALVAQAISRAFYACNRQGLTILSSRGLVPVREARIYDEKVAAFLLDDIPMVSKSIVEKCANYVQLLRDARMISNVSPQDVIQALPSQLETSRLVLVLEWAAINRHRFDGKLAAALRAKVGYELFASIQLFPPGTWLPATCIPTEVTRKVPDVHVAYFGWKPLAMSTWAELLFENEQWTMTSAAPILAAIARALPHLQQEETALLLSYLSSKSCIPTNQSLQRPGDSYLSAAGSFIGSKDFAIVHGRLPERLLRMLGCRESIDPSAILTAVEEGSLQLSNEDFVRQLARQDFGEADIAKLKRSALFHAKKQGTVLEKQRFAPLELVLPSPLLDRFPILVLNVPLPNLGAKESKFLKRLGVLEAPPAATLLELISSCTLASQDHIDLLVYSAEHAVSGELKSRPLLPGVYQGAPVWASGATCFATVECQVLDFVVLDKRLSTVAKQLGVAADPTAVQILTQLDLLAKQKSDFLLAHSFAILEYLVSRAGDFRDFSGLAKIPFVLCNNGALYRPLDMYLKPFPFLPSAAVTDPVAAFLRVCGSKDEPTPPEIATWVVKHGATVHATDPDGYRAVLMRCAVSWRSHPDVVTIIGRHPVLMALQNGEPLKQLVAAQDVCLIDDNVMANLFSPVAAPFDQVLESFYEALGVRWFSTCVQRSYVIEGGASQRSQAVAVLVADRIKERAPLLTADAMAVSSSSLKPGANALLAKLKIEPVQAIKLVRSFSGKQHEQTVTAALDSRGSLLVAGNGQSDEKRSLDFFDVSLALSSVILKRPRFSEQLLINTLLSTPLDDLRAKGFPIDRIIRFNTPVPEPKTPTLPPRGAAEFQALAPAPAPSVPAKDSVQRTPLPPSDGQLAKATSPPAARVASAGAGPGATMQSPTTPPRAHNVPGTPSVAAPSPTGAQQMIREGTREFDQHLDKVLRQAIAQTAVASAPGQSIKSDPRLEEVQKSFCDLASAGHDLVEVDQRYLSPLVLYRGQSHPAALFTDPNSPLAHRLKRFAGLIVTLAGIFDFPQRSLHIYFDEQAASVAFCRDRNLFFNAARFVDGVLTSQVFSYWYMVFSHELGHLHVHAHNADHEFYMSSYASKYMTRFCRLLLEAGVDFVE
ncbi:hypothetical protein BC828DRAFT_404910 [Blastocladiella britannica]|nr:hypothetical protein BC828DRAFT_404910 [Blastocladiella britannica]